MSTGEIREGDVYWLKVGGDEDEGRGRRPALVVQHDRYNRSRMRTTVVAALTSNLRLSDVPGNVRLRKGEADFPHPSVVNVTQLRTIDKRLLVDKLGILSHARRAQVRRGLALLLGLDDLSY